MLMVGAAEIIQERKGKSWSSDWDTWVAIQGAWKRLGVAVGPLPPKGYSKALEEFSESLSTNPLELPPEDAEPSERAAYFAELLKNVTAYNAYRRYQKNDRAQRVIGEDVAAELFPRREAVIQTALPAQRVGKKKEK